MLQAVKEPDNTQRLAIYSGHDSTIFPLLVALRITPTSFTDFAAHVVFEVYRDNATKEHYVHLLYNDEAVQLPGCDGLYCQFDIFTTLINAGSLTQSEFEAQCH